MLDMPSYILGKKSGSGGGGSSVVVDPTLSVEGAAAESKTVGDMFSSFGDVAIGFDTRITALERDSGGGGSVDVDKTMTVPDAAADASAVGDLLSDVAYRWSIYDPETRTQGKALNANGELVDDASYDTSALMLLETRDPLKKLRIRYKDGTNQFHSINYKIWFGNASGGSVSFSTGSTASAPVDVPTGAVYARISIQNDVVGTYDDGEYTVNYDYSDAPAEMCVATLFVCEKLGNPGGWYKDMQNMGQMTWLKSNSMAFRSAPMSSFICTRTDVPVPEWHGLLISQYTNPQWLSLPAPPSSGTKTYVLKVDYSEYGWATFRWAEDT